jgi:hypothetical protein
VTPTEKAKHKTKNKTTPKEESMAEPPLDKRGTTSTQKETLRK